MKEMKYIVTTHETETTGIQVEEIFVFDKSINHDCMAEMANQIKDNMTGRWKRVRREVVSAGFTDGVKCYGKSESLKLHSRVQEDTKLLKGSW